MILPGVLNGNGPALNLLPQPVITNIRVAQVRFEGGDLRCHQSDRLGVVVWPTAYALFLHGDMPIMVLS